MKFQLIKPIQLTLDQEENGLFIVSDDTFVVVGEGETPEEAMKDYMASLLEYYCIIEKASLGGSFVSQTLLQMLQQHLIIKEEES